MTFRLLGACAAIALSPAAIAAPVVAPPPPLGPDVQQFVHVPASKIAIQHLRIIDGTGAAPIEDATLLIDGAKIGAVLPAGSAVPAGYQTLDGTGETALPGLVGMHNHLFYLQRPNLDASGHFEQPVIIPQMSFSAPRLYLANGVTTMRTTGSVEPYTDLALKREIDAGHLVGPHLDVTGPYLEGAGAFFIQNHPISSPDDARKEVAFWADQGVNSFKAYMNITRAELKAAIDEAHRRHLKVTGHLCSVTYPEAVAAGDRQSRARFLRQHPARSRQAARQMLRRDRNADVVGDEAGERAGQCADQAAGRPSCRAHLDPAGVRAERAAPRAAAGAANGRADVRRPRNPTSISRNLVSSRAGTPRGQQFAEAYKNDLGLERQFVAAGGLLLAGPDPTGNGGVIPGFGDQREVELLVEAGSRRSRRSGSRR